MAIKRFDLAWITVCDMTKAKQFFVDTLGMKIVDDQPMHGWLEVAATEGGARLGVGAYEKESPLKPGENAIVTFSVDDIIATKKMLESKNVTIIGDIMEVPGEVKLLLIKDADGNLFHISQLLQQQKK